MEQNPHYQQMENTVNQYVGLCHDWYQKKKRLPRQLYRFSGSLIVVLSAMIPLLSAYDGQAFRLGVGIIGILISALTGLNHFLRWDKKWRIFSLAQFELEYLLRRWELKMHEAKNCENEEEGLKLAKAATDNILEQTKSVRNIEMEGFFSSLTELKS